MNESPALMRAVGYNANLPADDPASLLDVEVPALQPHDLWLRRMRSPSTQWT
jgi:hypothetical protein